MGKWRLVFLVLQLGIGMLSVLCLPESKGSMALAPDTKPQPFYPLLAPLPLMPFENVSGPAMPGSALCELNFSAVENIIKRTATDCWDSFASYLANAVCCPQLDATINILAGEWSIRSGELTLNSTHAKHCLSDLELILKSQGASFELNHTCSNGLSDVVDMSCPVTRVNELEKVADSNSLMDACTNIDLVSECCTHTCQNAILKASTAIASHGLPNSNWTRERSIVSDSCSHVVMRWLASKLDSSSANSLLRGISSCQTNSVRPFQLPDIFDTALECGNGNMIKNQTACCTSIRKYMDKLQNQSFITTRQASNCAAVLGMKLQKANVTDNVFDICHINLKDFSFQDSGCLLPSLPSDASYDQTSGFGFVCDPDDNISAPWPSVSYSSSSSCINTAKLPALHKSASAHTGPNIGNLKPPLLCTLLVICSLHLSHFIAFLYQPGKLM